MNWFIEWIKTWFMFWIPAPYQEDNKEMEHLPF